MTVSVTSVHIVIVVFPVLCAGIVGRIYKNAVFDTNRKSLLRHIRLKKA